MELVFYFFSIISFISLAIYVLMILNYISKWNAIEDFDKQKKSTLLKTTVSIIVGARNEEQNIITLLNCLVNQNYPASLFEIIIIDDHSEDNTAAVVSTFITANTSINIQLIQLKNFSNELKGKKAAIQQGILQSTGALIITTDADCTMGKQWLTTMVTCYELQKPDMIVAPVLLTGNSFFQKLQQIEFLSLLAVTASAIKNKKPMMCSGANLAYTRKIFIETGGFENNTSIASGDDTFLMFKIAKSNPDKVHFLKSAEAVVSTPAQKSMTSFFQQRIRWASKTKQYHLAYITYTAYLISMLNILIVLLSLLSLIDQKFLPVLIIMFLGKLTVDTLYIYSALSYFKINQIAQFPIITITAFIYPLYFLAIAFQVSNKTYYWKGRLLTNKS